MDLLVQRGNDQPDELSRQEWTRYCAYTLMVINAWEYDYSLSKARSTPPELWEGANACFASQANSHPSWIKYWAEHDHAFAEPFHSYAASHFPDGRH